MKNGNEMEYVLGLDIGTNSVGWAVVDDAYKLKQKKGNNMQGVVMFSEGDTAEKRRHFRSNRRRQERKKQRIQLLQEMFKEEIEKVDPTFFEKLEISFYHYSDEINGKLRTNKYNLFSDDRLNDKSYYKQFETIYHLRAELMKTDRKQDIRFIYLALHHIIKYRGNFLYEGSSFSEIEGSAYSFFENLSIVLEEHFGVNFGYKDIDEIIRILQNKYKTDSAKVESILTYIESDLPKKRIKEIVLAIVGLNFNLQTLFDNDKLVNDSGKPLKAFINSEDYFNLIDSIANEIEEKNDILKVLESINSWYELDKILMGKALISEAMIGKYDKHKADLRLLKHLYKQLENTKYKAMFKQEEDKTSYSCFIKNPKECDRKKLYSRIKKDLDLADKKIEEIENENLQGILRDMLLDTFLPRINSKENGMIPYQLHLTEMEKILTTQAKHYLFLEENKEKIKKLVTFRVPYYVGPLNQNSEFAWLVKRSDEKITPWNFEEVVDIDTSAENFIIRMTKNCSYLPAEKALPRYSLLYCEYTVLNEINKIRINGKLLDYESKFKIYNDIFKVKKKVNVKHIQEYLKKTLYPNSYDEFIITGDDDGKFLNTLTPFIDFTSILGEVNEKNYADIEQIIKWLTVYEDKKIVERRITKEFPQYKQYISKIVKLKYKGWGRLSKKLLTELKTDNGMSFLDVLRDTNLNFMQIISDGKYDFERIINETNKQEDAQYTIQEQINNLHGSPAIKKGIRIATKVIDEITKIYKVPPKRIYIEVARSDEESKRTKSRKDELTKLYKDISIQDLQTVGESLKNEDVNTLRDIRRYLYYRQLGKCMYSLKPLRLDSLHLYQIDHVLPQALVKDDSLDNLVLVNNKYNQEKSDYNLAMDVIEEEMKDKIIAFWEKLFEKKMISQKKYYNLINSDIERVEKRFINRQIVETRQIIKHLIQIIKNNYDDVEIFPIKAHLNHEIRDMYELPKLREVNDYHHAHDAYLACVIGNYISYRFPKLELETLFTQYQVMKSKRKKENKEKDRKFQNGFIINSMNYPYEDKTNNRIWDQNDCIKTIKKVMDYRNCFFNHITEVESDEFYNQSISSNGNIPLKEGLDVEKYGGYTNVNMSYMLLVVGLKKKTIEYKIVPVSIQEMYLIKSNQLSEQDIVDASDITKKLTNVTIVRRLLKYQLLKFDNNEVYLSSAREWINAKQLKLTLTQMRELEMILNYFNSLSIRKRMEQNKISLDDIVNKYFDVILDKQEKEYTFYTSEIKKIKEKRDVFQALLIEEKIRIIQEILKLSKRGPENANLKLIGLADRVGRKTGKTSFEKDSSLWDSSITGYYKKSKKL